MSLTRRPTPLPDMVSMREAMERLFDDRFFRPLRIADGEREVAPALDFCTTDAEVVARAALPGVKPDDVAITVKDDDSAGGPSSHAAAVANPPTGGGPNAWHGSVATMATGCGSSCC